jgi:hypothetical protein
MKAQVSVSGPAKKMTGISIGDKYQLPLLVEHQDGSIFLLVKHDPAKMQTWEADAIYLGPLPGNSPKKWDYYVDRLNLEYCQALSTEFGVTFRNWN